MTADLIAVIDCSGVLDDTKIHHYYDLGCEAKGRGRIKRFKDEVRSTKKA